MASRESKKYGVSMPKLTEVACQAAELLFELFIAHKRRFQAQAKEHGLSPPQAGALWNLEQGGITMSALAELLMCDASNVTGIVDKLEARGLAKRVQGEDRRVKVLTLTEEGKAVRETMRAQLLAPPDWLLSLNDGEQCQLRDVLLRASAALAKTTSND